jgi:hypothetical protein
MVTTQKLLEEIKALRKEVRAIKQTMPDREMFLTLEEKKLLAESYGNERSGKLTSSANLRKELGL